ncbi:MAG: hypothetical protein FJX76_24765, partial [Armatimonadetes bacterium]|nr:hypothetical protein [Armatimonadota bacterium]
MDASGNYGKISNLYHLFHSVDDSAAPEKSAEAPHEAPPDESPTDQVSVRQPSYLLAIQQSIAERLESVVRAMDEENPKKPEEKPQEPSAGGGRTPKAPVEAPPKPAPPPPQAEQKPAAAPAAAQGKPDDGGRAPGAAAPDQNLQNAQLRAAAETGDTLKQFARPQAARADEQAADLRAQDAKLATPGKDQAPAAEAKPGATPQSGIADAKAAGGDAKAAGVEVKAAGTGRGAVADAKAPARPATETKEAAKPSRFAALVETATKTAGSVIGRVVGGVTGAKVGETVGSTFGKTLGRGVDYVKGKISDIMRSRPAIRLQRAMQGTIEAQDNLTDIITGRKEEKSLLEKLREPEWNASDLASRLAPDDPDLATWLEQRLEHIMAQKLPKGERHQAIRKLIHELRAEKATRASGDAAADKKAGPGGSAVEKVAQKDNA